MVQVSVRYEGFDYNPVGAAAQVGPILRRTHSSLTRQIANETRARVPVLTGHLGRSVREDPQVMVTPFHVSGGVTAHAKYAAAVHEGTRPHVIRAKHAQALHFWWRGREVFVRQVNHPGTRARPYLRNAGEAVVRRDRRIRVH
ncbi:tail assembly chaperone [Mycobacterium phage Bananafish]|uniref:Tail assembly chaperone n=1 Tax=Mycobacterium phage Bananafish TaxID=2572532 RepID=A0A4D6T523_9CAUD|nr:tail assembly chaperone [Mycobacterium phage Bananafish]